MNREAPLDEYLALRDRVTREAGVLFDRYAPRLRCRRGCYYCCDPITVLPIEYEAMRLDLEAKGYPDPALLGGPRTDRGDTPETMSGGRRSQPRESIVHSVDRSIEGVFARTEDPTGGAPSRRRATPPHTRPAPRCAFLGRAGECTVYDTRPLICRTHGLPLAYRVYEYDANGREVRAQAPEYLDLWCDLNFRTLADDAAAAYFDANGRIDMDRINRELDRLNEAFLATESGLRFRDVPPGEDRLPLGDLLR